MKKKHILVGKSGLFLWIIHLFLNIALNVIAIYSFSQGLYNTVKIVIQVLCHTFLAAIFIASTFFINRSCNFVFYSCGTLERKGIFFGFRKKIDIKNIQKIETISLHLDGTFYVLIDGSSDIRERIRKKSAIFIPCTQKGKEFIQLFYSGDIPTPEE